MNSIYPSLGCVIHPEFGIQLPLFLIVGRLTDMVLPVRLVRTSVAEVGAGFTDLIRNSTLAVDAISDTHTVGVDIPLDMLDLAKI